MQMHDQVLQRYTAPATDRNYKDGVKIKCKCKFKKGFMKQCIKI